MKNIRNHNIDFDLHDIMLNLPGYIFWKDLSSVYRGCNLNGAALFGLKATEDIVGKTDHNFIPKLAAEFTKQDKSVIKTGRLIESEHCIVNALNGETVTLKIEKKPLSNKQGTIIGILVVAVNISHSSSQKETQQPRLGNNDNIQNQEATYNILEKAVTEITGQKFDKRLSIQHYVDELCSFFKNIILQMPCYVYWKDKDFKYIFCNKLSAEILGLQSPSNIAGKTDFDFGISSEIATSYRKVDERIIKTGKPELGIEEVLIKNNKTSYLLGNKMPLLNQSNEVIGIIGIAVDITEHRKAEELRLENEAYQVEKKSQEKFKKLIEDMQQLMNGFKLTVLNDKIGASDLSIINPHIKLSNRESQILYYLSLHKSPKEIAEILTILEDKTIAVSTIQTIVNKRLYKKLDVYNLGGLIEKATRLRLIPFLPKD